MTYLFLMTWPMMAIGWVTTLFQRGLTSLDRIGAVLADTPVLHDPAKPLPLPLKSGTISIRNLTFGYDGQDSTPVLAGVNLEIKPGFTGIVGKTGSGKTTLCQLLARIYPVEDSQLIWNSIDYNRLALSALRSQIAYVPQDTLLFSETIAANIGFGKPTANQEEIERAAQMAAIHDEIINFKEGYQSKIGEKGVLLSGGQRQRVALARALLMDRPMMIIDDGLSAVDTDTEYRIIRAFDQWLPGRTCIMVSHRVAPIIEADEIVVMDEGKIVAQGNHHMLLADNRFYRTIFNHQMSAGEGDS
ncbi:MAG: ABC transporter ATP-binding protein [Thermodesulfobacteriota bacterium]